MNKLDIYIIKNFIKSFILGMMMFFIIFLLGESIKLTGWIIEGKFTLEEALKYLLYGLPEIIINTAPLGILLGSLLSISKMAKQLEITAMKTNGISFFRISLFPLIFSFFISMVILYINYDFLGKANSEKSLLKVQKIEKVESVKKEKDFVMVKVDKNTVLYGGNVKKDKGEITGVQIIEIDDNFQNIKYIYTGSMAFLKENKWYFKDLKKYDVEKNESINMGEREYKLDITMDELLADPVISKNLTMVELREKIVYFNRVGADIMDLLIDFYYRISFSFSSFVMAFIGLALGSRYVRGGVAVNIGASVLIGYSYYGVSTILKSTAQRGSIPIYLACFIPLIVYFIIGLNLFKKSEY